MPLLSVLSFTCEEKDRFDLEDNPPSVEAVMGAGVRSRSTSSDEGEKLMNLYCGVTFLCCSPFLTENTVINLHLQSRASQREDQSGHYSRYLSLLGLYFMTREPNLQLQSFYTPVHLSRSIAEISQRQFEMWWNISVIDSKASSWIFAFSGQVSASD